MDETLLAAYRRTDYRVRLGGGGYASIRIGHPLPVALTGLVTGEPWGFITAWNPRSQPRPPSQNRQAQRRLLHALRELPATHFIAAGVGVGENGWREGSLFVVGPDVESLDALARRFGQHGYLHGHGQQPAQLRLP
ncbi:DUF3293 domain-containing protein [Dyella jiangningensis]|uniref:DUF3293 domain-containing protein n=1 Tax=Dyella jiangningensis TaxID=1379159 RepID=A0A328NY84_9GAMM|nr:DUF3293 domain-containing protein [Dyella jiangningensis]RAO75127.1 hypothetical protein CA260_13535 [Dyella jiangningensis]